MVASSLFDNLWVRALAGAILGILLFGTAVVATGSTGNDDARAALGRAERYLGENNPRAARIEMLNAIKADPDWPIAHRLQGEILLRLGDGVGAQAELDRALQQGFPRAEMRHLYGEALQLQGALDRALIELQAPDIPPQFQGYATRILGRTAMQAGDIALAATAFDNAARLEPDNPDLWVDIARFRSGNGDQAGAIAAVDEAVRRDNDNVTALQFRGELVRQQFGPVAAIPWFERALMIDASNVPLLTEYAATLGDIGRNRDMLVVLRKIIALDKSNPRAFFMQAVLAARGGQPDLAQAILLKTKGRLDDAPAYILVSGITAYMTGNPQLAVEKFALLLERQPENRRVRTLLARALLAAGDNRAAFDLLKERANRAATDGYASWLTGRALERLDARDEAEPLFNRAALHLPMQNSGFPNDANFAVLAAQAARNPDDARAVIPYIRALYLAGDFARGFAEARRLQAQNPGASDAHLLVADTALAMGNADAALDALARARAIRFSESVMLRTAQAHALKRDARRTGEMLSQYLVYNPDNIAALRLIGYAYVDNRNFALAKVALERVRAKIGDNDALLLGALAKTYLGLGDVESALKAARIAYHVQPSSPVASNAYGMALLAAGDREKEALELLEKAVSILPNNRLYQADLKTAKAEKVTR
ncbi:MAG: tetratricopeptide repeat protein [Parasphingorhabdus sp.]|nr:tetratricopeptide repeat protein [Parasphingorhabdus sp.]